MYKRDPLNAYSRPEASQPPIANFQSAFLGKFIENTADVLNQVLKEVPRGIINPTLFAILDEQSLASESGLIVQVKDGSVDSVRVHFDTINAELIRISMITFDIKETKELVGHDGVFRAVPADGNNQGRSALQKKIG